MAPCRFLVLCLSGAGILASGSSIPLFAPSPSINIVVDYRDHSVPLANVNENLDSPEPWQDVSAANTTLGFEAIIAVSSEDQDKEGAWRQRGLRRAARRTGVDIEISEQRDFTYKEVVARRDSVPDNPLRDGEALCYVAHLDALQSVVDRNLGSALIIEDDADWDVALRRQTGPVARAVRQLTEASRQAGPYGDSWDMLFLGHCGDVVEDPQSVFIHDPTVLPRRFVRSVFAAEPYAMIGERTRAVQYSHGAICTFGYAVTARSAQKVLDYLRSPGRELDLKMRDGCQNGDLTCVSVVPELIHHQRKVGSKSLSTGILKINEDLTTAGRRFTHNIRHSARCNWNRWGRNLVYCLPNLEEWYKYIT